MPTSPAAAAPLAPFRAADGGPPDSDAVLERFLEATTARGLTLYPEQEEAILELFDDRNVVLNTPTGSGKSLVATAMHFRALAKGRTLRLHLPDQGAGE
jgi:superfamily II RNA helicase